MRSGTVLFNPVEENSCSNDELFAGVAEKRGSRMKGRTHQVAFSLLASIDVHLHGVDGLVVLGRVGGRCQGMPP